MTNPAYEATNSDVEKLIKYARINAECGEHASPEETLKLVAALQREVDIRAQNLSIKLHMAERIAGLEKTLRGTEESLIAAVDQIAELESRPLCVKSPEDFPDDAELLIEIEFLDDVSVDIKTAQWLKELRRRRAAGGAAEGSE